MTESTATLYERLGGAEGVRRIIGDVVDAHLANSTIHTRFEPFDRDKMKDSAFHFFAMGTGGPEAYNGRGLLETHRGMNVNEHEFVAATDDVLAVLRQHGVGEREQQEVLSAFWSMKGDVLHH